MLAEPITLDEVAGVLLSAFPDLESDQVKRDIDGLVGELMRKDLLQYGGE